MLRCCQELATKNAAAWTNRASVALPAKPSARASRCAFFDAALREEAPVTRNAVPAPRIAYTLPAAAGDNPACWPGLGVHVIPYGGLLAGETVLVTGATGNLGSSAVALAMGAGCMVAPGRNEAALDLLADRFAPRVRPVGSDLRQSCWGPCLVVQVWALGGGRLYQRRHDGSFVRRGELY